MFPIIWAMISLAATLVLFPFVANPEDIGVALDVLKTVAFIVPVAVGFHMMVSPASIPLKESFPIPGCPPDILDDMEAYFSRFGDLPQTLFPATLQSSSTALPSAISLATTPLPVWSKTWTRVSAFIISLLAIFFAFAAPSNRDAEETETEATPQPILSQLLAVTPLFFESDDDERTQKLDDPIELDHETPSPADVSDPSDDYDYPTPPTTTSPEPDDSQTSLILALAANLTLVQHPTPISSAPIPDQTYWLPDLTKEDIYGDDLLPLIDFDVFASITPDEAGGFNDLWLPDLNVADHLGDNLLGLTNLGPTTRIIPQIIRVDPIPLVRPRPRRLLPAWLDGGWEPESNTFDDVDEYDYDPFIETRLTSVPSPIPCGDDDSGNPFRTWRFQAPSSTLPKPPVTEKEDLFFVACIAPEDLPQEICLIGRPMALKVHRRTPTDYAPLYLDLVEDTEEGQYMDCEDADTPAFGSSEEESFGLEWVDRAEVPAGSGPLPSIDGDGCVSPFYPDNETIPPRPTGISVLDLIPTYPSFVMDSRFALFHGLELLDGEEYDEDEVDAPVDDDNDEDPQDGDCVEDPEDRDPTDISLPDNDDDNEDGDEHGDSSSSTPEEETDNVDPHPEIDSPLPLEVFPISLPTSLPRPTTSYPSFDLYPAPIAYPAMEIYPPVSLTPTPRIQPPSPSTSLPRPVVGYPSFDLYPARIAYPDVEIYPGHIHTASSEEVLPPTCIAVGAFEPLDDDVLPESNWPVLQTGGLPADRARSPSPPPSSEAHLPEGPCLIEGEDNDCGEAVPCPLLDESDGEDGLNAETVTFNPAAIPLPDDDGDCDVIEAASKSPIDNTPDDVQFQLRSSSPYRRLHCADLIPYKATTQPIPDWQAFGLQGSGRLQRPGSCFSQKDAGSSGWNGGPLSPVLAPLLTQPDTRMVAGPSLVLSGDDIPMPDWADAPEAHSKHRNRRLRKKPKSKLSDQVPSRSTPTVNIPSSTIYLNGRALCPDSPSSSNEEPLCDVTIQLPCSSPAMTGPLNEDVSERSSPTSPALTSENEGPRSGPSFSFKMPQNISVVIPPHSRVSSIIRTNTVSLLKASTEQRQRGVHSLSSPSVENLLSHRNRGTVAFFIPDRVRVRTEIGTIIPGYSSLRQSDSIARISYPGGSFSYPVTELAGRQRRATR